MDLIEDEPRQQPKPVPFCQSALLQPMVPEVSLLLQDNFPNQLEKRNDSFSGTEFQTYNSWRWKHMNKNNNDKFKSSEPAKAKKDTNLQECYLIKDKYFTSETERRKNEILYGEVDEPRRPLPPRAGPVIPTTVESFFSNTSFDDPKPIYSNHGKSEKTLNQEEVLQEKVVPSYTACSNNFKKEVDSSEKLYSIISEQNKQMEVLQKQIDQLLKLQEVRDKQIEQLLNSQESKEKKIEQLMQSLDCKSKEVENLFILKEKQEQHIQELLISIENKQKENLDFKKELNEFKDKQKQRQSIGVMASPPMVDASTCISLDNVEQCSFKKSEQSVEEISYVRDSSRVDEKERSLSLHSSDLPLIQENIPTPQSSIHLDIQDFPDSSDDSETEGGNPSSFSTAKENQPSPLGYTFYNNVLTQVKDIIQNSGDKESKENKGQKLEKKNHGTSKPSTEYNFIVDNQGAVQSFHSWNVCEKENIPSLNFKRQERNERTLEKSSNFCIKDTTSPSDISLKINALAMKYLKQEQISQCGLQPQIPTSCQHDVTIYNVTNLSFGSMRYLDRYQMLHNVTEAQKQVIDCQKNEPSPGEFLCRKKRMSVQQNITSSIGNVLDISTLNQQPKLL